MSAVNTTDSRSDTRDPEVLSHKTYYRIGIIDAQAYEHNITKPANGTLCGDDRHVPAQQHGEPLQHSNTIDPSDPSLVTPYNTTSG